MTVLLICIIQIELLIFTHHLLPSFPGKDAIGQAIEHGVKVTGVTVHFVDEGMDTGPILAQACCRSC